MYRRLSLLILLAVSISACRDNSIRETPLVLPFEGAESADPALAMDPASGDILLSWVGGDSAGWSLFYSRSGDSGVTWSAPSLVATGPDEIRPQGESSPRIIAATGNHIGISWIKSVEVPGRRWPATIVRFARSLDGGTNWSDALTLNDDSTGVPAGHQFHGAAWSGDSGIVVAWLDERHGSALANHHGDEESTAADSTDEPDASIYMASSPDFGETWKPNAVLWGQVCPCCRVTLVRAANGDVESAWRKHYPGNIRDVVTAPIGATGAGEPVKVHADGWIYPGCPHTGPGIALGSAGERHVVWYVGKEGNAGVFYQKVLQGIPSPAEPLPLVRGRTLPTAHTTIAAVSGGGAIAAYDIDANGERGIGVTLIDGAGTEVFHRAIAGSSGGTYPQVVSVDPGAAVVAWGSVVANKRLIQLTRITFPVLKPVSR
ncbi:MAG: sialidase family protein [Gemmatimonadota bacterium]